MKTARSILVMTGPPKSRAERVFEGASLTDLRGARNLCLATFALSRWRFNQLQPASGHSTARPSAVR